MTSQQLIEKLEQALTVPPDQKGDFFFNAGILLGCESFNFDWSLDLLDHASKHYANTGNTDGELNCYANLTDIYITQRDFKKAIRYFKKALQITLSTKDRIRESACYGNLGNSYRELGNHRKAIEYYKKSLQIAIETEDRDGELRCYRNMGFAYQKMGDIQKAIDCLETALRITIDIEDRDGELRCYIDLVNLHRSRWDLYKVLECYEKTLKTAKETKDAYTELECYNNLSQTHNELGNYLKAIEYQEKTLQIAKNNRDTDQESICYTNLGNSYRGMGDLRKAIDCHHKALQIAIKNTRKDLELATWNSLGNDYLSLGDRTKAIECQEKALQIAIEIKDIGAELTCYNNLGSAYSGLGDFQKAIKYLQKALQIAMATKHRILEMKCYGGFGEAYIGLGDFQKAIEHFEKGLQIALQIKDRVIESKFYGGLGKVYSKVGDLPKAIDSHEKALQIAIELGLKAVEGNCYGSLGNCNSQLGNFRKAVECYEKSLQISEEAEDQVSRSITLANLGNAFHGLGDFHRSRECQEKALQVAMKIEHKPMQSNCYENLAFYYHCSGESDRAIKYYEKSLQIRKEIGDLDGERAASLAMCTVYYKSNPNLAYDYCKRSIELSEVTGRGLVEDTYMTGYYGRTSDAYQIMIPLCLSLGNYEEAFQYTERGKSRAFLKLLATSEIKPSIELTSQLKSLISEEDYYLARLREIQTRHVRETKVAVEPGEVESISERLNLIHNEIQKFDAEYVSLRKADPVSLDDVRSMLSSEKKNAVVLEYFITEDKVFIFVVSKDGLHVETVSLSKEKLLRYVKAYEREVVNRVDYGAIGDTWLELSDYLIAPISDHLVKRDLIYFIPYGALHYIPMHALEFNGEPLIKKHPVCYSPAASTIRFCKNKGTDKLDDCASFGVVFENEAEEVGRLFTTDAYCGKDANKKKVQECANKDIIHLSCHGKFDNFDPLSSGVVLHNEEILTAREIFNWRINAELVTLSACQTGVNETKPGDELIGLTRAFLYAGAPSVVVSLWSVYAPSTQELMLEFYKLLKKGRDKATALQEAQKEIMEKDEYAHPYFWAPFILVGDWE